MKIPCIFRFLALDGKTVMIFDKEIDIPKYVSADKLIEVKEVLYAIESTPTRILAKSNCVQVSMKAPVSIVIPLGSTRTEDKE